MDTRIRDILAVIVVGGIFVLAKYFQGFEDLVCFISAMILVELWKLNEKNN